MRKVIKRNNNKGFSLVELIIVIAIMALLVAIIVPNLLGYLDKARKVRDLEMARVLGEALQRVRVSNPEASKEWDDVGGNVVGEKNRNNTGNWQIAYRIDNPPNGEDPYIVYNMFEWTLTKKGDITNGRSNKNGFRNGVLRGAHRLGKKEYENLNGIGSKDNGDGAGRYATLYYAYVDELAYYDINIFFRKYQITQYRVVKRADNGEPEVWVCPVVDGMDGEGGGSKMYFRLWPNYDPTYLRNIDFTNFKNNQTTIRQS